MLLAGNGCKHCLSYIYDENNMGENNECSGNLVKP